MTIDPAGKPTRVRRTQGERRAATRRLLLDATAACLVDLGFEGTTTTLVSQRAGVSRGAQLHHWSTKAELLAATAADLSATLTESLGQITPAGDPLAVWKVLTSDTHVAWVELLVAARTDDTLTKIMGPLDTGVRAAIAQALPPGAPSTSDFLLGLAFQRITRPGWTKADERRAQHTIRDFRP